MNSERLIYLYRPYSEGMGKVLLSQVSVWFRGVPHLHHIILPSTGPMCFLGGGGVTLVPGPMSFPRGTPIHSWWGWGGVTPIQSRQVGEDMSPARSLWGTPPPSQDWMGVSPPSKLDGGNPPSPSRASTCYTAVDMPLVFTQEDFLVYRLAFEIWANFDNWTKIERRNMTIPPYWWYKLSPFNDI